jgi:hypothetical protein
MRRVYTAPTITVHGGIEALTRGNPALGNGDGVFLTVHYGGVDIVVPLRS